MTTTTNPPQMPAPKSLGGGMIPVFRCFGPKLGDCTTPGCAFHATDKCTHKLVGKAEGQLCNKPICGKCGGTSRMCPPHQRLAKQQAEKVKL